MNSVRGTWTTFIESVEKPLAGLGRVPALIYLVGYLALIFLFSLVYSAASFGKELSSAAPAPPFNVIADSDGLVRGLRAELIQDYRANGRANRVVEGWRLVTDDLDVSSLYTASLPSMFSFILILPVTSGSTVDPQNPNVMHATVTVYTDGRFISNAMVYLPFDVENTTAEWIPYVSGQQPAQFPSPGMQLNYDINPLFGANLMPATVTSMDVARQAGASELLPLSLELYERITETREPSRFSTQYLQMLFFSVGVATSSAPGTIVPMSTAVQAAVMAETILSVILVALFLNSLVHQLVEGFRARTVVVPAPSGPAKRTASQRSTRSTKARAPKKRK